MISGEHRRLETAGHNQPYVPDMAWQHNYGGGLIRLSWEAVSYYGMQPVTRVTAEPDTDVFGGGMLSNGHPATNITVVSPVELLGAAEAILKNRQMVEGAANTGFTKGRIDTVKSFPVTKKDPLKVQEAYFKEIYKEYWPPLEERLRAPGGFSQLIAHLLVNETRVAAQAGISAHLEEHPRRDRPGLQSVLSVAEFYGATVKNAVHSVFCGSEYTFNYKPQSRQN